MPQTTVTLTQPKWLCEGQMASTSHRRIDGAIAVAKNGNSGVLPFGRVSEYDPSTGVITTLSGAISAGNLLVVPVYNERFGIPLAELSKDSPAIGYPEDAMVEYITIGDVVMYSETAVKPGDALFYRHTAATSPNDVVGRVRNAAVAGETPADATGSLVALETIGAAGLVAVRVNTTVGL